MQGLLNLEVLGRFALECAPMEVDAKAGEAKVLGHMS